MRRCRAILAALLLVASCNGGDQLGEPWGSPMQHSTALADTPYPPRNLAMFDGVNGRVVMWADLMRLVRRTSVIVIDGRSDDRGSTAMRSALVEDVQAGFPPVAVMDCGDDAGACADLVREALDANRRVVVRCTGSVTVADAGAAIRGRLWFSGVTTVAMLPLPDRSLRAQDRELADVVAYCAPQRAYAPAATKPR
jgi:hypothetical protein